jgi:hypothetical protein
MNKSLRALLAAVRERWDTSERPYQLWASRYDPPAPYWELSWAVTPLEWGLGFSSTMDLWGRPDRAGAWVQVGPCSIVLTRQWGPDTY